MTGPGETKTALSAGGSLKRKHFPQYRQSTTEGWRRQGSEFSNQALPIDGADLIEHNVPILSIEMA